MVGLWEWYVADVISWWPTDLTRSDRTTTLGAKVCYRRSSAASADDVSICRLIWWSGSLTVVDHQCRATTIEKCWWFVLRWERDKSWSVALPAANGNYPVAGNERMCGRHIGGRREGPCLHGCGLPSTEYNWCLGSILWTRVAEEQYFSSAVERYSYVVSRWSMRDATAARLVAYLFCYIVCIVFTRA